MIISLIRPVSTEIPMTDFNVQAWSMCQNYNGNFIKIIQMLWAKSYYQTFNKLVQFYKV